MTQPKLAKIIGWCKSNDLEVVQSYFFNRFHKGFFEWRSPKANQSILRQNGVVTGFHQDGCGDYIVVWSNREQTVVRIDETGEILPVFPPYAVLWVDNIKCSHKTPSVQSPDRCFVRLCGLSDSRKWKAIIRD